MLKKNPLTEDEHVRVASLMREIDDLSKRGRLYASTGGTSPDVIRRTARAYNDRVAVLRVLIGNRPVERLEQKWLYGPVAWTMIVGQEWNAVVRPRERAGAGVACNPSTCKNPKHHHAARRNVDFSTPTAAQLHARKSTDPATYGYYTGYADGLSAAKQGMPIDSKLRQAKDDYARGYTAGFAHGMQMKSGVRKNTDIAGAMIAGASAAIVGRMIRGNPGARKNFRSSRIRRRPKPGECEIGLVSQDNCYRKATVDVEMGLKRGTPLRVCQRHADWIKRMKGNPASRKRYSPPRDRANMFEVFWMSGKQTWHGGPFFGRPGAEKYVERYKAGWKGTWPLRYVIMSYKQWGESGAPTSAPEWIRAWQTNSRSKHRPSGRHCTSCGTPLKRGESLMCAFCRREGSYAFNKTNPCGSRPNTDVASRREALALAKRMGITLKGAVGGWIYMMGKDGGRGKPFCQGWNYAISRLQRMEQMRKDAQSGVDLKEKYLRSTIGSVRPGPYGMTRPNPDPNKLLKERAQRLAAVMGYRVSMSSPTGHGVGIYMYVDKKGISWDDAPLARTWKEAARILEEKYARTHGGRRLGTGGRRLGDIGPYGWQKNPLASGGWKGWDIRTDRGGFIKRLGKSVVVHVYLNKGPAPNIWTWRIIRAGKRVAGGDVPTDEIARRRALAALRGTRKNPDELTGTMIVKCSTCKCVIRTEPCIQEFDGKISHGFCPTHQAEERAKVEAWIASRKAARNPRLSAKEKAKAKEMATWPKCVTCGKPAGFSVDWLYPQRVPDNRPCCSSRCAVAAVKKGRPASNPSSKIPMYQIRNWVGKFHVGTSNQQIEAALKAQIAKSKDPRWTPATIRQAVAVALKEHHHNQAVYHQVMTGRF